MPQLVLEDVEVLEKANKDMVKEPVLGQLLLLVLEEVEATIKVQVLEQPQQLVLQVLAEETNKDTVKVQELEQQPLQQQELVVLGDQVTEPDKAQEQPQQPVLQELEAMIKA